MGWWIRTRDSVLFRLCQIHIYINMASVESCLHSYNFMVHLWIPKWVRMSSGEAYCSPLWDDYLTQPSVKLGLGDNIMYCVLSRLPKSCINFLFLGPGNFWDIDKKEKGMILEETIPCIFLLTPSLHAVSMRGGGQEGFPIPIWRGSCGTFQSGSLVDSLSLSLPPEVPIPSPQHYPTIPFSLFPHLQGQLEQIRYSRKPDKEPIAHNFLRHLAPRSHSALLPSSQRHLSHLRIT